MQKIPHSNLILLVVDTLCPCGAKRLDVRPREAPPRTVCRRPPSHRHRRRPRSCISYHPEVGGFCRLAFMDELMVRRPICTVQSTVYDLGRLHLVLCSPCAEPSALSRIEIAAVRKAATLNALSLILSSYFYRQKYYSPSPNVLMVLQSSWSRADKNARILSVVVIVAMKHHLAPINFLPSEIFLDLYPGTFFQFAVHSISAFWEPYCTLS